MRVALGLEYNGAKFHGWQSQRNVITLQATFESALTKVANEPIRVICAGRTDAGVHATNQVVHFDTHALRKLESWVDGVNTYLPSTMSVQWARAMDSSFHARFSALSRRYQYFIYNCMVRPSLLSALTTWVKYPLDEHAMHRAGQHLIGEHDFSSFRGAACQSSTPQRRIFAISVTRHQEMIKLDIIANSFLHHMVRNIASVLIDVGGQRKQINWCQELLAAKNRNLIGKTAPPQGLYLTGVRYADVYNMPCDFCSPHLLRG